MINLKTCAFLLVDMQNDFLAKGGYYDRKQKYLEQVRQGYLSIVEKHTFDGFFKTDLLQYLHEQRVNTILFAGVETHICVLTTALSASLNHFTTIILEDCVASARNDLAESALKIFQDGFADVKMSTDIFPELL